MVTRCIPPFLAKCMYGSGVYVSFASQPLPWGRGWLTRLVYCIRDYDIFSKVVCVCNGSGAYAICTSGDHCPMLAQVVCIAYTPLPLHILHDVIEAHCYIVDIGRHIHHFAKNGAD